MKYIVMPILKILSYIGVIGTWLILLIFFSIHFILKFIWNFKILKWDDWLFSDFYEDYKCNTPIQTLKTFLSII